MLFLSRAQVITLCILEAVLHSELAATRRSGQGVGLICSGCCTRPATPLSVHRSISTWCDVSLPAVQASQPELLAGEPPAVTIKAGNALGGILEDSDAQVLLVAQLLLAR